MNIKFNLTGVPCKLEYIFGQGYCATYGHEQKNTMILGDALQFFADSHSTIFNIVAVGIISKILHHEAEVNE